MKRGRLSLGEGSALHYAKEGVGSLQISEQFTSKNVDMCSDERRIQCDPAAGRIESNVIGRTT